MIFAFDRVENIVEKGENGGLPVISIFFFFFP